MELTQRSPGLFETVRREMRLRNMSHKTIKAYPAVWDPEKRDKSCLRAFVRFFAPRHPREVGEQNIRLENQ